MRIPAEWTFAEVKEYFPLTNQYHKLKLFQTRPLVILEVAFLLANFRICFRGGNATTFNRMMPPQFEDYVNFGVKPKADFGAI